MIDRISLHVRMGVRNSAFWILSLNSWMQTPAGHSIENGVFYVDSWMAVLFNPSFLFRLAHMVTACLLTAAFFVAGVSAWRILKRVDGPATYHALRSAIVMAALLSPLQIFIGDLHGLNTFEHQPAKIAAIEAVWETDTEVPFTLFGFPDEETRSTHAAIEIPYLGSLILTHDIHGEVRGLNDFIGEHPPVSIVFWSFRVMVGIGTLMLLVSWWSLSRIYRKQDFSRFHLQTLAVMTISGWVAVLAGWFVTEIGRQPWMVYNLIRVDELVAEHGSGILLTTLVTYALLYLFLTFSYISAMFYLASQPSPVVD